MAIRMVEVWNDDTSDYTEVFKGDTIVVPAKNFIKMEDPDASQFLGQYVPFKKDGQGRQLGCKMLRKVYIPDGKTTTVEEPNLTCQMCKETFRAQGELDGHIAQNHTQAMIEEEAKKAVKKQSKFFS